MNDDPANGGQVNGGQANGGQANDGQKPRRPRRIGPWIAMIALLSLLAISLVYLYVGWNAGEGSEISAAGYFAMIVGGLVTLALGIGLMALIFYGRKID